MARTHATALASLARQLGRPPRDVAFLEALDDAARQQLTRDIEHAQSLHAQSLRDAMEGALNQLPRLLRIPIRTLFGL